MVPMAPCIVGAITMHLHSSQYNFLDAIHHLWPSENAPLRLPTSVTTWFKVVWTKKIGPTASKFKILPQPVRVYY